MMANTKWTKDTQVEVVFNLRASQELWQIHQMLAPANTPAGWGRSGRHDEVDWRAFAASEHPRNRIESKSV